MPLLALLALASLAFPLLAQAKDSAGAVYEPEVPSLPNGTVHTRHPSAPGHGEETAPGARSSGTAENGGGQGEGSSGSESGRKHESAAGAGANDNGGGNGQGSEGGGPKGSVGQGQEVQEGAQTSAVGEAPAHKSGGGSSALVPILIAIAILAAISIGAVIYRQRRQGGSGGSPVSPKAS